MKNWKTILVFLAILSWSLVFSADNAAAEIANASQFVNLVGNSNTGVINSFQQVLPNSIPQTYSIPQGKAVVIQYIKIKVSSVAQLVSECKFIIGPYYSNYFKDLTPAWMIKEYILPIGFAVSDNNALVAKITDQATGFTIPGNFEVQMIGYVLPLTAGQVPLDLLLLGKTPGLKNLMAQALLPNAFPRIDGQFPQGAIAKQ